MRAFPILLVLIAAPVSAQINALPTGPPPSARLAVDAAVPAPKRIQQLSLTTESEVVPPPQAGHAFGDEEQQITLEVRFVSAPSETYRHVLKRGSLKLAGNSSALKVPDVSDQQLTRAGGIQLVSAAATTQTHAPISIQFLEDREVKSLLEAVQSDLRGNVLFASKVTLFNRQTATIKDTREYPFAVGMEQTAGGVSPQIQTFEDGTQMAVRCRLLKDSGVRVDLGVRLSRVEDVGLLEVQEQGMTLQVPTVHTQNIQTSANVAAGRTLAIRGIYREVEKRVEQPVLQKVPYVSRLFKNTAVGRDTEELVILLTPRVVRREPEERATVPAR